MGLPGMIKKLFFLLLFFLICFIPNRAQATVYYLDSTAGDCTGNYSIQNRNCSGSDGTSRDTIGEVENLATSPGDIVYLRAGTYDGTNTFSTYSGSTDNYITFEACHDGSDGDCSDSDDYEEVIFNNPGYRGWWIEGVDWIKFKGFKFDADGGESAFFISGSTSGTDHIYIEDCEFYDGGDYGIIHVKDRIDNGTISYVTIINSIIHTGLTECIYFKNGGTGGSSNGTIEYSTLENLELYDCGEPIQFSYEPPNTHGANHVVFRNIHIHDAGQGGGGGHSGTSMLNAGDNADDILIEDCIIHDDDDVTHTISQGGIALYECSNVVIRNNLIYDLGGDDQSGGIYLYDCTATTYVYYNTIDNMYGHGIYSHNSSPTIKNNIISNSGFGSNDSAISDGVEDYNVCYNNYSDCSNTNDQNGDPKYHTVTEGSENFHLLSGSSAIDNGTNVGVSDDIEGTARPQGEGYDMGAYEYQEEAASSVEILQGSIQGSVP